MRRNMSIHLEAEAEVKPKLKPCPFCGGRAVLGMFSVWCDDCGVETQVDTDLTEKEVIAVWNLRKP